MAEKQGLEKRDWRPQMGLLLLVLALFFLNFYSKTLFFRPGSTHQWRQADCLSIAKNYYEQGMHFFEPEIHFQGEMKGKAVSEFPILNYTAALLWKLFGEQEFLYRLLEYLLFLSAIFVLFNTLVRYFKSLVLAFFTVSVFLTSPLLVFYGLNFIADVPALSLSIICFCYTYQFYQNGIRRHFYLALGIGTLAVLMKASALIPLSVLLLLSVLDISGLGKRVGAPTLFEKKGKPLVLVLLSIALIFSWYRYALYYNDHNSNNIFLLTVLPIWNLTEAELIYNTKMLFNNLFPIFLNKPMLFVFFVLVVYVASNLKKLDFFLRLSFLLSGLFFLLYLMFFYQVFSVHDYYLVNLMIFPVITLFCFSALNLSNNLIQNHPVFARVLVILVIVFNGFYSAAAYRNRMIEDDKLVHWYPFISEDEQRLAKYFFWDYGNNIKKLENFRGQMRAHGILRTDRVLSMPDQSFDISLYFLDQKGYTASKDHVVNDSTVLDRFLHKQLKYLVMNDTTLKKERAFQRILPHLEPFFASGGVEVFKFK